MKEKSESGKSKTRKNKTRKNKRKKEQNIKKGLRPLVGLRERIEDTQERGSAKVGHGKGFLKSDRKKMTTWLTSLRHLRHASRTETMEQ